MSEEQTSQSSQGSQSFLSSQWLLYFQGSLCSDCFEYVRYLDYLGSSQRSIYSLCQESQCLLCSRDSQNLEEERLPDDW